MCYISLACVAHKNTAAHLCNIQPYCLLIHQIIIAEMHVQEWETLSHVVAFSQAPPRFLLLAVWKSGREPGTFPDMNMTHMHSEKETFRTNIAL